MRHSGATLGGLSGRFTSVYADGDGFPFAKAGVIAAALWVLGTGGRLAFQVYASHGGGAAIERFSVAHSITSVNAWTAALILMALSEAVCRTSILAWRANIVRRQIAGPTGKAFPDGQTVRAGHGVSGSMMGTGERRELIWSWSPSDGRGCPTSSACSGSRLLAWGVSSEVVHLVRGVGRPVAFALLAVAGVSWIVALVLRRDDTPTSLAAIGLMALTGGALVALGADRHGLPRGGGDQRHGPVADPRRSFGGRRRVAGHGRGGGGRRALARA